MSRKKVTFKYIPYAFFYNSKNAVYCSVSVHMYDAKGEAIDHCFDVSGDWAASDGPRVGAKYVFEVARNIRNEAERRARMLQALGYKVDGYMIDDQQLRSMIDSAIAECNLKLEGAL